MQKLTIDHTTITCNNHTLPVSVYQFLSNEKVQAESLHHIQPNIPLLLQFSKTVSVHQKQAIKSLLLDKGHFLYLDWLKRKVILASLIILIGSGIIGSVCISLKNKMQNEKMQQQNNPKTPRHTLNETYQNNTILSQTAELLSAPGTIELISVTPQKIIVKSFVSKADWDAWVRHMDALSFGKNVTWDTSKNIISDEFSTIFLMGDTRG